MSTVNFNDTTPSPPADGSVNIRFQSDASGNISGNFTPGAWKNWTPTIAGGGSMSVTVTTLYWAKYLQIGNLVWFNLRFDCTTSGTAATNNSATMPVPTSPTPSNLSSLFMHIYASGGAWQVGYGTAMPGNQMNLWTFAGGGYPIGSTGVLASGWYEVA